jgi:hypothetical protein
MKGLSPDLMQRVHECPAALGVEGGLGNTPPLLLHSPQARKNTHGFEKKQNCHFLMMWVYT